MIALVVFALVGAAAAQFNQFPAQQFNSFGGANSQQLLPPVFPVPQTRAAPLRRIAPLAPITSFAPQGGFAAPQGGFAAPQAGFAAPQRSFAAPVATPFAAPVTQQFAAPTTSFGAAPVPVSRPIQLDSGVFVDSGVPVGFQTQRTQPAITVVERKEVIDPAGQYSSSFRDSAGSSVSEQGQIKPTNDQLDNVVAKNGQYSYVDPAGKQHVVSYTADEYGFHPVSDDIPVAVVAATPTF